MMKILRAMISAVMVLVMLLPVAIFADEPMLDPFVTDIGEIDCPYGTPTIDGAISDAEGWSQAVVADGTNTDSCWGGEEVRTVTNIYRAWDDEYLYIAADIAVPELVLCTDVDTVEGDDTGNKPGWNGDVFIYSVDPLQALLNTGFSGDPAPWYCFGVFEGGEIRTYRTHVNDGEITDTVSAKGAVTDNGWRFEAAISWETLCEDIEVASFGDAVLTPEIIAKNGNKISGSMIYYDRYYEAAARRNITYSRYITIAYTLPDGTPGVMCSGWYLQAHGMHFMLNGYVEEQDTTTADVTTVPTTDAVDDTTTVGGADVTEKVTVVVTDDKGKEVTDDSGNKVTAVVTNKKPASNNASTTRKQNTSTSTGASSSQTFDMTIAVALGALAISGVGIVAFKKRK